MKVALITDTHFGCRNDSQVFNKYHKRFYDKIFFPYLKEHNIKTCIHLGDVVDRRKFINYRTLKDLRENFIKRLWEMGVDTHIIIGNHDTFYKNTNEVNSIAELFSTYDGQIEPWMYPNPKEIEFDGLKILMMPWICDDNRAECMTMIEQTDAQILMGHLEVKGFEMHTGQFSYEGTPADVFQKFDMAMSGHFHHKSDNGNIYYLGNPYQITWSDYKDARGFHIFDTATRELEHIINPFEIFHKIYYDDENLTLESIQNEDYSQYKNCFIKIVIVKRNNPFWFDTLIDKLYKVDVADISVAENFDVDLLDGEDLINEAEDTMTILSKYVESLSIDNKKELDFLLQTLYTEALSVETV